MPTLTDNRFEALRAQGFTGATSDMILQWLHANGATSPAIPDAWREMLLALGAMEPYQRNDTWYKMLGDLGYEGSLNDREMQFWALGGSFYKYDFDGIGMYATMPPWAAQGKPRRYSVSFNANAVSTGTEQHILSGTEGGVELAFYLHATLPVVAIRYRSDTGTQASEGVFDVEDEIIAGTDYNLEVINLGTGSQILLNGKDVDITAFEASDGIQPALTHIGAKHDATSFFGGTVWASMLYDESPITNTWANMGNGSLYGELEQPIVLEGDFEISFDWIRQNQAIDTLWTVAIGATSSSPGEGLRLNSTGNSTPNGAFLRTAADDMNFSNALDGVAIGQHVHCRVRVEGLFATWYTDEVEKGQVLAYSGLTIEIIGGHVDQPATLLPTNSALQNIVIKDLTNNLTWNYPLDEGPATGSIIHNTDPSTPGYSGAWTDTDWTFIADNSRRYPMNDGPNGGGQFKCIDGTGTEQPALAADIIGYDEGAWD